MMNIWLLLFFLVIANSVRNSRQFEYINIGALFYDDEYELEESFGKTIQFINTQKDVNFKLIPIIDRLFDADNPLHLEKKTSALLEKGVAAIFGPSSKADSGMCDPTQNMTHIFWERSRNCLADIVSLICSDVGIPHILFDRLSEEREMEWENHRMSLNVYPSRPTMSKAYADIVYSFGWRKFSLVYDADDGTENIIVIIVQELAIYVIASAPFKMQDILQLRDLHDTIVRVRKYKRGQDYRVLWKSIKNERRVILDCPPDILVEMLNASIPYGLAASTTHIFLTNLETQYGILEELKDNVTFNANITAARFKLSKLTFDEPINAREDIYRTDVTEIEVPPMKLLPQFVHDSVMLFFVTLKNITAKYKISELPRRPYVYKEPSDEPWVMGLYINRVMKTVATTDDTYFHFGYIQFDEGGQRANFTLEVYDIMDNFPMALWESSGQITLLRGEKNNTKKIIYKVATRYGPPYFMQDPEAVAQNITGNARYRGYAVDLLAALADLGEFDFEYEFVPVADGAYGNINKDTGQWNGIIAELINNDAHLGICDLTITQARKTVVDFTVPFMQLGISILDYQKPMEDKPWNSFLDPFTKEVWIYVMISVFLVAFLFMFVARISTEEWENPHPCNKNPDVLENSWHLSNSFWLTMGSIMTAGSDILPRSAPMRTFNAMWWIFAVIIANSYIANLAAFLTNSKREGSIGGVSDLIKQSKIKFGTILGGSTATFFAESNETVYRLANQMMQSEDPSVFTIGNDEGVERVKKNNGSYMFLMETTTLEYNRERNCDLRMVGEKFGEKHYAIAVPLGAEYRSNLSVGILKLGEKGVLFSLKKKWWTENTTSCPNIMKAQSNTNDLNLLEVRGIFYSLLVGVFIAYIVGITEFLIYTQHVAGEEKLTFKEAFLKEIKFVLKVWNNKKPVTTSVSSRSSSHMSSCTDKSCRSGKSGNTSKSHKSHKIVPIEEMQERKSTKSLKSVIINIIKRD